MRMLDARKKGRWGMRMPIVRAPTDAEAEELLAYLKRNALLQAAAGTVPEASDPRAKRFADTCSRCHVLPDPGQHTAEEWPAVVERMRQNMARMRVPPIDDEAAREIVAFLSDASRG